MISSRRCRTCAPSVRCAVDIRNVDVDGGVRGRRPGHTSGAGLRVSRSPNLVLGFMVRSVARGASTRRRPTTMSERKPEVVMGRQLAGSRLGIIGYGSIGRYLAAPISEGR